MTVPPTRSGHYATGRAAIRENSKVPRRKSAAKGPKTLGPTQLQALIESLGTRTFTATLALAAEDLIRARHIALIAFDDRLVPSVVAAESLGRTATASAAGKMYERSYYYRHDPNVRALTTADANHPLLLRLKARDIEDAEYRRDLYERFGLIDRLSLLHHAAGHWLAVNFYREQAGGEYSGEDVAALSASSMLLATLVGKHFSLLPPAPERTARRPSVDALEALVKTLDSRLTSRQVQVCARALLGMTNVAVGLDLGIQVPTVATLRKRAYSVLGISSLNELFALCLAQSTRTSNQR
jgi:DNA-binding CsgD family transcriptional regulator